MEFRGKVPEAPDGPAGLRNGHWSFPEQMGGSESHGHVGFIYVIRDNVLERLYLGKKLYYGMGKLNRGKESNWRTYTSSAKILSEMLKVRPKDEFDFICIEQYRTKGTLSYSETWSLCYVEAPTSNTWFNKRIEDVSWNVKERITDRHKERLNKVLRWEKFDD